MTRFVAQRRWNNDYQLIAQTTFSFFVFRLFAYFLRSSERAIKHKNTNKQAQVTRERIVLLQSKYRNTIPNGVLTTRFYFALFVLLFVSFVRPNKRSNKTKGTHKRTERGKPNDSFCCNTKIETRFPMHIS